MLVYELLSDVRKGFLRISSAAFSKFTALEGALQYFRIYFDSDGRVLESRGYSVGDDEGGKALLIVPLRKRLEIADDQFKHNP